MSVVEIDERGRITLPKAVRAEAERALLIPMGDSCMIIPVSEDSSTRFTQLLH